MTASIHSRTLSMQVQEAAKKAMEELKRDHPDVDPSNIKVDVPVSGPAKAGPHLNQHQPLRAIPAAWGLPAVPDVYRAYGADPAVDRWGAQGFRQRAELEEERYRAQMRMRLEQAALREDLERVRRNMYMAMPPLPPVPQVQPVRRHVPRLLPVPPPPAAQRRRRR